MNDFEVKIVETSRPLSAKERIAIKNSTNGVTLDNALSDTESLVITPTGFAILEVHNEKAKGDKDYVKYVIISDGTMFTTGSRTFFSTFRSIWDEMQAESPDESFSIEVFKRPSKNYSGKYFISCNII